MLGPQQLCLYLHDPAPYIINNNNGTLRLIFKRTDCSMIKSIERTDNHDLL